MNQKLRLSVFWHAGCICLSVTHKTPKPFTETIQATHSAVASERCRKMNASRVQGFTYVEALVVCASIVTIIAILMPSYTRVREHARATICASNLSQTGQTVINHVINLRGVRCAGSISGCDVA